MVPIGSQWGPIWLGSVWACLGFILFIWVILVSFFIHLNPMLASFWGTSILGPKWDPEGSQNADKNQHENHPGKETPKVSKETPNINDVRAQNHPNINLSRIKREARLKLRKPIRLTPNESK